MAITMTPISHARVDLVISWLKLLTLRFYTFCSFQPVSFRLDDFIPLPNKNFACKLGYSCALSFTTICPCVLCSLQGAVNFKFGVLYAKAGQKTDNEMFSNGEQLLIEKPSYYHTSNKTARVENT